MRFSAAAATDTSSRCEHDGDTARDGLGDPALADQTLTAGRSPGPGLPLGLGGPDQGVGPAGQRAGPLLGGAQREPGIHLGGPRGTRGLGEPFTVLGVGVLLRRLLGGGEPLLEVGEPGEVTAAGLLGGGDRGGEPLGLALGGPGQRAELAELLGDRGQGGVGLVQLGERHVDPLLGLGTLLLEPGEVERESLAGVGGGGQLLGGLVDRGLHLDEAGLRRGAAGSEVGPEQVPLAGDRGGVRQVDDQATGGVEAVHDRDLEQHAAQRRTERGRALDHVDGVDRAGRQRGPLAVVGVSPAEQDPGSAEVFGLQVPDRADSGVDVLDRDGVGGGAEGRGDRGLVAGAHREQRGDRPQQAGHGVGGGQQGAGTVLAVQAELEGLLARGEGALVALGGLRLLPGLGEPLLEVHQRGGGALVLGVQSLLTGVEAGDPGLQGR